MSVTDHRLEAERPTGGDRTYFLNGHHFTVQECREAFGLVPALSNRKAVCLELIEGHHIVDIGCHVGYFVVQARQRYPEKNIEGIDYHEDNVDAARLIFPAYWEQFHRMSVYDLKFEPGSVDCVTFQATIEHLEQAALAIKEINRILKPGGALIVTTDNPYYWCFTLSFIKNELANAARRLMGREAVLEAVVFNTKVEYARHVYSWTPATLLTLMVVNGFEYVEHRYASEPRTVLGKLFAALVPFIGSSQILKVRKVSDAPGKFV